MSTQPQTQNLPNPSNQPTVYLAVQGSKTPKPAIPEGTGNGKSSVLGQPPAGQICTCPPQVHKALLEGQLISRAGTRLDFGSDRNIQLLQLYKPVLAIPSDFRSSQSSHEMQLLIPGGQTVLTPNSTTGTAQYVLLPTAVNPSTQMVTQEVNVVPDILLEKEKPEQQISCVDQLKTPGSDSHTRIACMKNQLAHLSAWVRLLQQNPEAANQSMHIVGYSHRHCDDDFCRAVQHNQSSLTGSTEAGSLFYTPSSSSLDSAYSARSTTSSESGVQLLDQSVQQAQKTDKCDLLKDNAERYSPKFAAGHPPRATYSTGPSDSSNPCSNCSDLFLSKTNEHNTKLQLIRKSLQLTQNDLLKVKQELAVLRRMYSATMNANHECTCDAIGKIRKLLEKSELIKTYPIRSTRTELDREIFLYREATENAITWLNDLELIIEDMRISALTRRCYVDLSEVECLSTHLQRVTCRLKDIQNEFPKFSSQLQKILNFKMSTIERDKGFLISDSDRLECALRLCKDLSSTLFTLKRTVPEPSQEDREQLMHEIQTVTAMSDRRMTSIQQNHMSLAHVCLWRRKIHTPPITSSSESIECCADKQDDATINPAIIIPTILKRNSTRHSPQSDMKQSSKHYSDANRRSRVVFSRTVLVSNGSETTQLNFPSDTDEESGRIYPEGARHTVDDMVINRTSQPWTVSIRKDRGVRRPISYNEYAPVQSNVGTAVRGTHTPKYKRFVANPEPLHIRTALNAEPADLEISAHRNQRHHHNCQKVRHKSIQYASNYNSLK
ncbi:hypothetical protein PHET_01191 [Paragonimus heterotremus]|uniref:Actin interacting protein 3-like C-terminal domain-containing protein n=1 Tax=Paragonimus heterotremus TaxID=100268 RepID=A0A8J4WKK3_9TREM|nr:hypothetical protein PHET_01191 [Paragonimus heterotremus]